MHSTHLIDRIIRWIGSASSLVVHTLIFIAFFALASFGLVSWSLMLLILTTIVSLEAIYLAIFIQMTVNRHSEELEEVGEDVEEIQENIEEMSEDVEDLQVNVEDIQEDIEEISEDEEEEARKLKQLVTLDTLTADVKRMLEHLESLKGEKQ